MKITASEAMARLHGGNTMRKAVSRSGDSLTLLRTVKETKEERVFVFKDGDKGIIAPADDALPEVIGEFFLDEENTIPPPLAWWLTGYAKEVKAWQEYQEEQEEQEPDNAITPMRAPSPAKAGTSVPTPLLNDIKWNQWSPWNDKLDFGDGKCYTGCVCTAISQVVYYWAMKGRKRGCLGAPAYTSSRTYGSKTYKYNIPKTEPVAMFDYDNMFGILTTSTSKTRKNNVAAFCAHVGKVIRTNYSPSSAGSSAKTWVVQNALEDYFKLGEVEFYEHPSEYKLTNVVLPKVREALAKGIPVIMVGSDVNNAGACHCFVCDGYDESNDRYSINWGYSGKGDGWFTMDNLVSQTTPSSPSYNFSNKKSFHILKNVPPLLYDVNNDGYINMVDVTEVLLMQRKTECSGGDFNRYTGMQVRAVRAAGAGATSDCVDLGLPSNTLWATCNVGASEPGVTGGYYAWGEKSTKSGKAKYGWGYYAHCDGTKETVRNIGNNISGTSYDVAKEVMGTGWVMPTNDQWNELLSECDISAINGILKVTGPNGNSIALPLSGCIYNGTYSYPYRLDTYESNGAVGYYWSSNVLDGDISMARGAKLRALALSPEYVYTGAADVNFDGKVNNDDTQAIIDWILGKNR